MFYRSALIFKKITILQPARLSEIDVAVAAGQRRDTRF